MKKIASQFSFFALTLFLSCSSSEDPQADFDEMLDGADFNPTEQNGLHNGEGIEIRLTDDDKSINLRLSNDALGIYEVDGVFSATTADGQSVVATYTNGNEIYLATSGELTITSFSNDLISGSFEFKGKSLSDKSASVTNISFTDVPVSDLSAYSCLIKSITEDFGEFDANDNTVEFIYGINGKLTRMTTTRNDGYLDRHIFYLGNNPVISITKNVTPNARVIIQTYNYSNGRISSIETTTGNETITDTYSYDVSGKFTTMARLDGGIYTVTRVYTYTSDNLTTLVEGYSGDRDYTTTYSLFDSKESAFERLEYPTSNHPAFLSALGLDYLAPQSKNNPGKRVYDGAYTSNYSYGYNTSGYVTSITRSGSVPETFSFTYYSCN